MHLTEQEINKIAEKVAFRQLEFDGPGRPASNVFRAVTEVLYQNFGITTRRVDPDRQLSARVPEQQMDMPIRFATPQKPMPVDRLQQSGVYPLQLAAAEVKFALLQQLLAYGEKVAGPFLVDVQLVGRARTVKIEQTVAEGIPEDQIPHYPYSKVKQ